MDKILTIAIPTYNRKNKLQRALDSILSQIDERVEILVSDNASDDGTMEMMQDKYPDIRYSRNEQNVGGGANFLKCCELAQGRFFILFGSDDVLVEGSLNKIIIFLEKNKNCSLVFMNHVFFSGDYIDLNNCGKKWLEKFESLTTVSKSKFMDYAKHQISFMSCLIFSKEAYKSVQNPMQYIWTYFLHTNIALEFTKNDSTMFGIIGDICVADNITPGEASIDEDYAKFFKVFGQGMYYTFCEHAVQCGYDKKLMNKVYKKTIAKPFIYRIIFLKSLAYPGWKEAFWKFCYPATKHYPLLSTMLVCATLIPRWLANLIYNKIRPMIRKLVKRGM